MASARGVSYFSTVVSDSPTRALNLLAMRSSALSTSSFLSACTCSSARTFLCGNPVPANPTHTCCPDLRSSHTRQRRCWFAGKLRGRSAGRSAHRPVAVSSSTPVVCVRRRSGSEKATARVAPPSPGGASRQIPDRPWSWRSRRAPRCLFRWKTFRLWAKDRNAPVPEVIRISRRRAATQCHLSGRSDSAGASVAATVASTRCRDPTDEGAGARKRYPRLGTVSMYRGFSASSPSASRSLRTATRRLASKSTNVFSSQMRLWICSRVTTCPAFSRRITSRRKGWSCSSTRRPCLRSSPVPGCTSKDRMHK